VHHAHSAAADLAEDAVMGNRLTHGLGGRSHCVDMLGVGEGKVNVAGTDDIQKWHAIGACHVPG
jgi:hypothetical protein